MSDEGQASVYQHKKTIARLEQGVKMERGLIIATITSLVVTFTGTAGLSQTTERSEADSKTIYIQKLEEQLRTSPNDVELLIEHCHAELDIKNYNAAKSDLNKAVRIAPNDLRIYKLAAVCDITLNDQPNTASDMSEIIKREPNNVDAYIGRTCAFLKMNDFEKALRDATAAVKLCPTSMDCHQNLANVYAKTHQLGKAEAEADECVRLAPRTGSAYRYRAIIRKALGENKQAEEDIDLARALDYAK